MDDSLVIETHGLTKRYGELVAVDRLNLRVRRGEVYAFLGPNGAGKTTTLRMLLGLVRPTAGSTAVLGAEPGSPDALVGVGAMVETPGFYPFLSGRDNLGVLARHARVTQERIATVLEEVGLADRAADRFAAYSQGMKQRLGLAAALLKDPELVVLDEPTNGLDPAGGGDAVVHPRARPGPAHRPALKPPDDRGRAGLRPRRGHLRRDARRRETVDELRGQAGLRVRAEPSRRLAAWSLRSRPSSESRPWTATCG